MKRLSVAVSVLAFASLAGSSMWAATFNVGILSFDTFIPSSPGPALNVFNISNLTGDPDMSGFALLPDFPVFTSLTFLNASLTLTVSGVGTESIPLGSIGPGPLLDAQGQPLSWLGFGESTDLLSAVFKATIFPRDLLLGDGSRVTALDTTAIAILTPSSGPFLVPGVDAQTITVEAVPEPGTLVLMVAGIILIWTSQRWHVVFLTRLAALGAHKMKEHRLSLILVTIVLLADAPWMPGQSGIPVAAGGRQEVRGREVPPICVGDQCPQTIQPTLQQGFVHVHPEIKEERDARVRAEQGLSLLTTKPVLVADVEILPGLIPDVERLNVAEVEGRGTETAKPQPTDKGNRPFLRRAFVTSPSGPPTGVPDSSIAAGPENIVLATNAGVAIYDKNGGRIGPQVGLTTFVGATDSAFDPKVIYDEYANRFWVSATSENDTNKTSTLHVALSRTSDATQGWMTFSIDAKKTNQDDTNLWCDYPQIGIDTQALYVSCNMFEFGGDFRYSKLRVMTKTQFLNNTCCLYWDFFDTEFKEGSARSNTLQPAYMHGARNADGEFIVVGRGRGGAGSTLDVYRVTNPQNCCVMNNQSAPNIAKASVAVGDYDKAPGARQPNNVTSLETGGTRLLFAFWKDGKVSTGQTLNCDSAACVAFTELDVSGFPTVNKLSDFALKTRDMDTFYPAGEANGSSNRTLVFNISGPNRDDFAKPAYIGIPPSSACTDCVRGPVLGLSRPTQNTYEVITDRRNRWGDYSGACADPDGKGVWIFGEFAGPDQNTWGTLAALTYAPRASLTPNTLNFRNPVGVTTAVQSATLTNTGDAPLTINKIDTSTTNCAGTLAKLGFEQTNNCPASLAPGASCNIDVKFTPTNVGTFTGVLFTKDDADGGSFRSISLQGTGDPAAMQVKLSPQPAPNQVQQSSDTDIWVTASGFPADDIDPADVVITFRQNQTVVCVVAQKVAKVAGAPNTRRFAFRVIPGGVGNYELSISGMTTKKTGFSSSNSATLKVTPRQ